MKGAMLGLLLLVPGYLTAAGTGCPEEPSSAPVGLWVQLRTEWKAAPPEIGYKEDSARARFLRIHEDGQVSILYCLLLRTKRETGLSPADGYVVYRGSWSIEGQGLVVHYVKAEEMIPSSDPPFASFLEAKLECRDGHVFLGGDEYVQNDLIALSDYDDFVRPYPVVPRPENRP